MISNEDKQTMAEMLRYMADCIQYCDRLSFMNDCNNCGRTRECAYLPKWGEDVRINCPHWVREDYCG
jgi:hypothetical protein